MDRARFTPIREPIIYEESHNDDSKMVVGFENTLIFGMFEYQKHHVIRINDYLDQDFTDIPSHFLNGNDSGELFDIVTLKPTTAKTTPWFWIQSNDKVKQIFSLNFFNFADKHLMLTC